MHHQRWHRFSIVRSKAKQHWIPFIFDLRMLWSPVQNFESALGITHEPTRSLSVSSRGPEIDWKRTRVGTVRSFHFWTDNILPPTPTAPRGISIIETDKPLSPCMTRTWCININWCREDVSGHEPNGMSKLRWEVTHSGGKVKL